MGAYGVYQQLMDYSAESLQDDAYLIVTIGWQEQKITPKAVKAGLKMIGKDPNLPKSERNLENPTRELIRGAVAKFTVGIARASA